jgi:hypothetical protein
VRGLLLLSAALLAAAVLAACGGDGDSGEVESSLQKALLRMVLEPEDLPQGFAQGDESFITNEDLASSSADLEARKGLLEKWGRLLGYEVTYEPKDGALEDYPVQGINVSASLYLTEEGAAESFADAVKKAEETDWAGNYAGLRDFQQKEVAVSSLADEIVWLRLSGFLPVTGGPDLLVTDDLIFFRVGRERGFLRVQTNSGETEDRQHLRLTVEEWLRALIENVEEVLAEPDLEVREE